MDTNQILNERNTTHGAFTDNARVSQALKAVLHSEPQWDHMNDVHRESLEYICGKIGRLMAGDFTFDDTWDDIAGYAKLPERFNHGRI